MPVFFKKSSLHYRLILLV